MGLKVQQAKLTGRPDRHGWSQVHEFRPVDAEKFARRGHLFAVISTFNGDEGVERVISGREVLSRLHEEYFGQLTTSSFETIKDSVRKVTDEFVSSLGNVEIGAASVLGDVVYIAASNGARVYLYRDKKLITILEGGRETTSASGRLKSNDLLIIGSSFFFKTISEGLLREAVGGRDINQAVEFLAPRIQSERDEGAASAVFLKFVEEKSFEISGDSEGEQVDKVKPKTPKIVDDKKRKNLYRRKPFWKSFSEKVIKVRRDKKIEKSPISFEKDASKKTSISVGAILAFLLVVSIFFGIKQKKSVDFKKTYEEQLGKAQHELEEALNLYSINPERSRELFATSKGRIDDLVNQGIQDQKVLALMTEIEKNEGIVLGEYRVEAELFVDLSLLTSGFKGDKLASFEENLYVADLEGRRVVSVNMSSKRSEVVAGPSQIDRINELAVYANSVYILNSEGVYEVKNEKRKVIDADWESDVLSSSYAGNFYILEKSTSSIWRFQGQDGQFGSKKSWLASHVEEDFSGIVDLNIDGSIWTLSNSSVVKKFNLGNPQNFEIKGVFPEINNLDAFYTDEDLDSLYILDKENGRVIVVSKEGNYEAQYIFAQAKDAKDLVSSEKERRLILLTGDKLYSIELKHF